jgi:hypothetical protein
MSRVDLERIHEWVTAKLSGCQDLKGVGSQYERLLETVDAMLTKTDSIVRSGDQHCNSPCENAQRRLAWCKARDNLLSAQAARVLRRPADRDIL